MFASAMVCALWQPGKVSQQVLKVLALDEEIKAQRGGANHGGPRFRCAHAEQSVEYNLTEFRGMRDGKYKPREAFLRMLQDIEDGNPQVCKANMEPRVYCNLTSL